MPESLPITASQVDLGRFLTLASAATQALAEWHRDHGVHGRLVPGAFRLTGGGHTGSAGVRLAASGPGSPPPAAHLAPEQLGLLARGIDERTDLYALGTVLYELVTRRSPFEDAGAVDRAYRHPVRRPVRPTGVLPELPRPVEDILLKLLAALPEDRYQSAAGLAADLDRCRLEFADTGRIGPFLLGSRDVSEQLRVSGRLFGRQQRLNALAGIGNRLRTDGRARLVCVTGEPGVGKSAFAAALAGRVAEAGGWTLRGKFDQHRQATPYEAVAQALSRPAGRWLAEPGRSRAAPAGAGALVELLPALAAVPGAGPAPADIAPLAARGQLRQAVRQFLTDLAEPGRPLVLVLDDLQWADQSSLDLLAEVLHHRDSQHLLVVGTYQSGDLRRGHPLRGILKELRQRKLASTVELRPLPDAALAELLADTLDAGASRTRPLASVVADKAGSTPLAVGQFLHHLHERELLRHSASRPGWVWDLELIRAVPGHDDLPALVDARVGRRSPRSRRLLELAALLGDRFDAPLLSAAAGEPAGEVATELRAAVQAHLLVRLDDVLGDQARAAGGRGGAVFHWRNDVIRQAVLSRIPDGQRRGRHARIAAALAATGAEPDRSGRIFDLVWHEHAGARQRATSQDRLRLAELHLAAGRKANRLGDPGTARDQLAEAVARIPATGWSDRYELALAVYTEASRAEYATGNHARADELLATALTHARGDLDRAGILRERVRLLAARGDHERAAAAGLQGLALLGVDLPVEPASWAAAAAAATEGVGDRLRHAGMDGLAVAPGATDPRASLAATLVAELLSEVPDRPHLSALLAVTGVRLALDHGPTDASILAFAQLGADPVGSCPDEGARELCLRVALRLLAEPPAAESRARAAPLIAAAVPSWYESPRLALELFPQAHRAGLECGEIARAVTSRVLHHLHLLAAGAPLERVADEIDAVHRLRKRYPVETSEVGEEVDTANRIMEEAVRRLRGRPGRSTGSPLAPQPGEERDEAAAPHLISQIMVAYILGEYPHALRLCEAHEALTAPYRPDFLATERTFYHALTLAALSEGANRTQRPAWQAKIDALHADLEQWATRGPASFGHKALLVSAERARLAGDTSHAMGRFDRAIGQAKEFGFVHIEAIAAELAGRYARQRDDGVGATAYLRRARNCYLRWAAQAKVDQVDQALSATPTPRQPARLVDQLDLLTVVKACQALTAELELDKALAILLELLVQHSGAERGCLLLPAPGGLRVAAAAEIDGDQVEITHTPVGGLAEHVPPAVVQYTHRTRELVVGGEEETRAYASDPYLARRRPRSLLCAPISRRQQLVAILYLEHGQLTDVFTQAQLDVLEILSAQAAIALENAAIYAHLADAHQVLNATLDELPVGLILLHPDLTVRRASTRAEELCEMRMPPGTPVRRLLHAVAAPPDLLEWVATPTSHESGPRRVEITVAASGTPVPVDVWTGPLRDEQGVLVGIAVTLLRVTG